MNDTEVYRSEKITMTIQFIPLFTAINGVNLILDIYAVLIRRSLSLI